MSRHLTSAIALVMALAFSGQVAAQTVRTPGTPIVATPSESIMPSAAVAYGSLGSPAVNVDATHGLPTIDPNNAAFQGAVLMTVGTTYTAQRSLAAVCTTVGNITVTFADASSMTVPVNLGYQAFPYAITAVSASTATCTFNNLK